MGVSKLFSDSTVDLCEYQQRLKLQIFNLSLMRGKSLKSVHSNLILVNDIII